MHQFARARTIDQYDVTMPVPHFRVTSQINSGDVTMLSKKRPSLETRQHQRSIIAFSGIVYYHYSAVIMGTMASQITSLTIVYSTVNSAPIKENIKAPHHWPSWGEFTGWPVNSPHKGPVTRKMLPFHDVIMKLVWDGCHSTALVKKSTLAELIAWCSQTTSHYLSQCWPRSMSSYGATRPQCVNTLRPEYDGRHFADYIVKCILVSKLLYFDFNQIKNIFTSVQLTITQYWFR